MPEYKAEIKITLDKPIETFDEMYKFMNDQTYLLGLSQSQKENIQLLDIPQGDYPDLEYKDIEAAIEKYAHPDRVKIAKKNIESFLYKHGDGTAPVDLAYKLVSEYFEPLSFDDDLI
ncbi:MAG: hypothetical protein ABIB43_03170 [archaeon]